MAVRLSAMEKPLSVSAPLSATTDALTRALPFADEATGGTARPIALFTDTAALDRWMAQRPDADRGWCESNGFRAKPDSLCLLPDAQGGIAMVLAGIDPETTPYAAAFLADRLPAGDYRIASIDGVEPDAPPLSALALGWGVAGYRFDAVRNPGDEAARPVPRLVLPATIEALIAEPVRGVWLTRDLVNLPANLLGPAELAEAARLLASRHNARLTVLDDQDRLARDYPAVFAVGMGSDRAPRLIDLCWGDEVAPKVTLVGKGVCFDTGGLDLKPSSAMLNMKKDMGGAAQVLGLAHTIMAARLNLRLRVLIPAVENAVSGRAFRPRDVIATRAGITVEVGNTDAEGRLVLADALTEADGEQPELLFDFATLTGAARVALGPDIPALMTPDDALAMALQTAGQQVGDPIWRLPLWAPYAKGLASKVADTSNITTDGFAGAITAGLFLQKFVRQTALWAHFDVFAWSPSHRPGRPEGGAAQAWLAVHELLRQRYPADPGHKEVRP